MGAVDGSVNLNKLIEDYKIKNYVETGTGRCESLIKTFSYDLKRYGIELDERLYEQTVAQLGNYVSMFKGYTKDVMHDVLTVLDDSPTLFWLDAHYPGSDYFGQPYDSVQDKELRAPLELELKEILSARDISNDVLLMDDLRMYVDRPFQHGNWFLREPENNYDFVNDLIGTTHTITEHMAHEGYIICLPISVQTTISCIKPQPFVNEMFTVGAGGIRIQEPSTEVFKIIPGA